MCVSPRLIADVGQVPCRECWQCKKDRRRDWIGRCIAEERVARHTLFGTLTYGMDDRYDLPEDNIRARMLTREDVVLWLKRLRHWTDGRVRFFITGEYGKAKGRAHWHVLLFCEQLPPNMRFGVNYLHWARMPGERNTLGARKGRQLWPWGWSYWKEVEKTDGAASAAAYVCKYVTKPDGTENREVLWSSKPPLGHDYFVREALRHVDYGLSPQDRYYNFGEYDKRGTLYVYRLNDAMLFNYLDAFVQGWRAKHGNDRWPWSPLVDQHMELRRKRDLRKQGLPDIDPARFEEQEYLRQLEEKGQWHLSGVGLAEKRGGALGRRTTYYAQTIGAGDKSD